MLPGICFTNEQKRLNAFSSVQYVEFPSNFSRVIVSPSQPTVEEQDALWVQTDGFNTPIQQFLFSSQYGQWIWPHQWPTGDPRLVLFAGAAADVDLLDGGDAGLPSATTGPFWEISTEFTDKLPIGAGATVPEGADSLQFDAGTPAYPALRGVYFIKRTSGVNARQFLTP